MAVYFLVNPSGDVPYASAATLTFSLDFRGPSAPRLDALEPVSPGRYQARWTHPPGESTLTFDAFCAEGTPDSTAGGDSIARTCSAPSLVPDEVPNGTRCMPEVDGTQGAVELPGSAPLYAVGIVATDAIGNVGELSNVRCVAGTPGPEGDPSAESGCACTTPGAPSPTGCPPLLATSAALLYLARRRITDSCPGR